MPKFLQILTLIIFILIHQSAVGSAKDFPFCFDIYMNINIITKLLERTRLYLRNLPILTYHINDQTTES